MKLDALPELLLARVLSLLDMKDSVRTSILSKDWRYRWTGVDCVVFHFNYIDFLDVSDPFPKRVVRLEKFIRFVDTTLERTYLNIRKFSVTGEFYPPRNVLNLSFSVGDLVDKWLDCVYERKVEDLNIGFRGLEYEFRDSFYSSASLESLEIDEVGRHIVLSPEGIMPVRVSSIMPLSHDNDGGGLPFCVCWPVLRKLSLKRVYIDDEFMVEILEGCPVLGSISLDEVGGLTELDLTHFASVIELRVLNCSEVELHDNDLEINAPKLQQLEVSGTFHDFDCVLTSVDSLKSAKLTLNYSSISHVEERGTHYDDGVQFESGYSKPMSSNIVEKLLKPVLNVDSFVIGQELLQVVSILHLREECDLPFNFRHLSIHSPLEEHELPGISYLLGSSPNLESLVLRVMASKLITYDRYQYAQYRDDSYRFYDPDDYLDTLKQQFSCIENVQIDAREQRFAEDGSDVICVAVQLVAYIIKNAPLLKNLVMEFSESNYLMGVDRYETMLKSEKEVGKKAKKWQRKITGTPTTYEVLFA